ncbi:hypothetical protein EMPG_13070 [Blastomyces silverae]|uniref:Uncharacterized protein n=1 Tax=Blastomyces silverae TaxID=2060906 RepID=A0A0H1BL64_9EURO|nr:hypothetical protein EMPG_13070 [Blastomyces silverae]
MPANTRSTNREETPENQPIAGSFPTPITARKPRNNQDTQDNSQEQDNMADEAAALRQRITQMDEELHRMRAQSTPTPATANDNDLSPDLAEYLRNQGDTPALSKVLTEFRERVKYLQKPSLFLKSMSDYPI